jgi:hypothetical protein
LRTRRFGRVRSTTGKQGSGQQKASESRSHKVTLMHIHGQKCDLIRGDFVCHAHPIEIWGNA